MSTTISVVAPATHALATLSIRWSVRFGHYTVRVTVLDRWNDCHEWIDGPFSRTFPKDEMLNTVKNRIQSLVGHTEFVVEGV